MNSRTPYLLGFLLATALSAPLPLSAQEHPLTTAELNALAGTRSTSEAADRSTVAEFLAHADVRRVADRAGIDMRSVRDASGLLGGQDLANVASRIRDIEDQLPLVGGDTIVISATTIIIALLVIILIVVS